MLAPMVLARRDRAWWYAALATVTSVLGGILGYLLGAFLFDSMGMWVLDTYNAHDTFSHVQDLFREYGVWIVFVAGFTPIPYKVFTITSGVMAIPLFPFIIASLVGRAGRFFLVAGLLYWGGERIEEVLQKWVEWIGWITLAVLVLAALIFNGISA
jgi:membrane protein YqaA with SNARE-associated domain